MSPIKGEIPVRSPGEALLHDLITAAQEHEDQVGFLAPGGNDRRKELGRRWRGTTILARVSEEARATVTKHGLHEVLEDSELNTWEEPVEFKGAVGRVKDVSPAHGGYIELTGNMCISLPKSTSRITVDQLGLDIEVLDLGPVER